MINSVNILNEKSQEPKIGEINIEITVKTEEGATKHTIRGYEFLGILENPESKELAFIVRKPELVSSSWTLAKISKYELPEEEKTEIHYEPVHSTASFHQD